MSLQGRFVRWSYLDKVMAKRYCMAAYYHGLPASFSWLHQGHHVVTEFEFKDEDDATRFWHLLRAGHGGDQFHEYQCKCQIPEEPDGPVQSVAELQEIVYNAIQDDKLSRARQADEKRRLSSVDIGARNSVIFDSLNRQGAEE